MTDREFIKALYAFFLNRGISKNDLDCKADALANGLDPKDFFESLLSSAEFKLKMETKIGFSRILSSLPDYLRIEEIPFHARSADERVTMTVACRDTDCIPKVENAGSVLDGPDGRIQVMHNGLRVVADGYCGAWTTEIIRRLRGHHEPQEEVVFHEILRLLPSSATMIELGGYWSYYSLWFLSQAPSERKAVVIEPDPENLKIGMQNASLNSLSPRFVQMGVGPAGRRAFQTQNGEVVDVEFLDVPAMITRFGVDPLDILHCDAQGAELEVILSCENLLRAGAIRFVVVSTHVQDICGDPLMHQRCLKALAEAGGRILLDVDVHESFGGDGVIVAYFGKSQIDWREPRLSRNRYSESLFENPIYAVARNLVRGRFIAHPS